MYKPIYVKPFIVVYHIVAFIIQMIIKLFKYSFQGLGISAKFLFRIGIFVGNIFTKVFMFFIQGFKYFISGVTVSALFLYKVLTTIVLAIVKVFTYIGNKVIKGIMICANWLYNALSYFLLLEYHGFAFCWRRIKHFGAMVWLGIDVVCYYVMRGFQTVYEYILSNIHKYQAYRKRQREIAHQRHVEARVKKEQVREAKVRKKMEEKARRNDLYIDQSVVLNKGPSVGERINQGLVAITSIPHNISHLFSKTSVNKALKKKKKKKRDFDKEVLDLDLEEEEKKKKKKDKPGRILYEYVAKDQNGKTVKGYFEAFNKMEVKSFLINEGLEVYSIRTNRWITIFHKDTASGKVKMKTKDLVFFLTQLSTYIKAGITLAESLEILSRQFKNKHYQRILKSLVYDLNLGVSFSEALEKQGEAFPRLLINMIRASELSGSLPEVLDDQANYFDEMEQTRKQMITAMMYPSIVFVIAIGVLTFVMLFVVPQFVEIFESMDGSQIPAITLFIMDMSEFVKAYLVWIIIGFVIFCLIFRYLYKNVTLFRRWVQIIIMHMPVFGNVIIYNEVTTFTKTFSSLMSHNVFITDTMNILKKITNNEIYKELINKTIDNLSTGERISAAFKDHWAFPVPAYEMLVTGERTGELPEMMGKVSLYYQDLHKNAVARIKIFVEPILIIMLTAMVGVIVLAIIVPMFQMYDSIQSM